ncbi:MAG: hypothetical protein ACLFOY_12215 [Desulfatibacillaceae bacterium]
MSKRILAVFCLVCVVAAVLPAAAQAGALFVELKNGSRFFVNGYWHDKGMISFEIAGGRVGFLEKDVECVREVLAQADIQILALIQEAKQRKRMALAREDDGVQADLERGELNRDISRLNDLETRVVREETQGRLKAQEETGQYHIPLFDFRIQDMELARNNIGEYGILIDGLLTRVFDRDGLEGVVFKYLDREDDRIASTELDAQQLLRAGGDENVMRVIDKIPAEQNPDKVEISVKRFQP